MPLSASASIPLSSSCARSPAPFGRGHSTCVDFTRSGVPVLDNFCLGKPQQQLGQSLQVPTTPRTQAIGAQRQTLQQPLDAPLPPTARKHAQSAPAPPLGSGGAVMGRAQRAAMAERARQEVEARAAYLNPRTVTETVTIEVPRTVLEKQERVIEETVTVDVPRVVMQPQERKIVETVTEMVPRVITERLGSSDNGAERKLEDGPEVPAQQERFSITILKFESQVDDKSGAQPSPANVSVEVQYPVKVVPASPAQPQKEAEPLTSEPFRRTTGRVVYPGDIAIIDESFEFDVYKPPPGSAAAHVLATATAVVGNDVAMRAFAEAAGEHAGWQLVVHDELSRDLNGGDSHVIGTVSGPDPFSDPHHRFGEETRLPLHKAAAPKVEGWISFVLQKLDTEVGLAAGADGQSRELHHAPAEPGAGEHTRTVMVPVTRQITKTIVEEMPVTVIEQQVSTITRRIVEDVPVTIMEPVTQTVTRTLTDAAGQPPAWAGLTPQRRPISEVLTASAPAQLQSEVPYRLPSSLGSVNLSSASVPMAAPSYT